MKPVSCVGEGVDGGTDLGHDGRSCRLFDSGDGLQEFKGACEVRPVDLLENSSFQLLDRLFQKADVLETVFDQEAVCITQAMTSQGFDELGIFRFARPRAKCAISSELAFPSNRASRIACPVTRGRFRSSRSLPPEPFADDSFRLYQHLATASGGG